MRACAARGAPRRGCPLPRGAFSAGLRPGVPRGSGAGARPGGGGRRIRRRRRRSAAPGGRSSAPSPETGPAGGERGSDGEAQPREEEEEEGEERRWRQRVRGPRLPVAPPCPHPSAAPLPSQPPGTRDPARDGARRFDSRRPGAASRRPAPGGEGSRLPAQLSAAAAAAADLQSKS